MGNPPILVVDDEKNIRLTLSRALEATGYEVASAVNGEDALAQLEERDFGLMLVDLQMPGMDGMELLRRVRLSRPDIPVIIITAHGSVDIAVDAMRLGAVDFIQKPFSPDEIRELVRTVLDRDRIDEERAHDYLAYLELAKLAITRLRYPAAMEHVRNAIGLDATRPEAFNLMGALYELSDDMVEAQSNYRAALALDPTYEPAQRNLKRASALPPRGAITLGDQSHGRGKGQR